MSELYLLALFILNYIQTHGFFHQINFLITGNFFGYLIRIFESYLWYLSIIQLYFPMVTYCHCFILIFSISRAHYTWATGSWDWVTTPHIINDKESSFVHSFKFWKFQEKNWMEGKLLGRNLFHSLLEFATNSNWKFWLNRKRPWKPGLKRKDVAVNHTKYRHSYLSLSLQDTEVL